MLLLLLFGSNNPEAHLINNAQDINNCRVPVDLSLLQWAIDQYLAKSGMIHDVGRAQTTVQIRWAHN